MELIRHYFTSFNVSFAHLLTESHCYRKFYNASLKYLFHMLCLNRFIDLVGFLFQVYFLIHVL